MNSKNVVALLVIAILVTALAGCTVPSPIPTQSASESSTLKGVSLSPRTYDQPGFEDFFTLAKKTGLTVTWAGDWDQLDVPGQGPEYVTSMSSKYGVQPVMIASYYSQSEGRMLRPMDDVTKARYLEKVSTYAKKNKPEYMGLGIEVNIMAEKSPAEFEEFVDLYAQAYDAVKAVSPGTKVFTVFQLERMKGLQGGLFGGSDDPGKAQWQLLDRFNMSDLYAFTTYPCLIYKDPAEIPSDYYREILSHTSKPIAFTEIGWYSGTPAAGWDSSEDEQARFVRIFFNLTADTEPMLQVWSFMYDQQIPEPFPTTGLLRTNGGEKPAWGEWTRA